MQDSMGSGAPAPDILNTRHLPQTPFPPQSDRKKMPWRMKFSRRVAPFSTRICRSWGKILMTELFFFMGFPLFCAVAFAFLMELKVNFNIFFYPVSGPKPLQSGVTAGPLHRSKVNLRYFVKFPVCTAFLLLIQHADFNRILLELPPGTGFAVQTQTCPVKGCCLS